MFDKIEKNIILISSLMMALITIIVFGEVVMRYLFGRPIPWSAAMSMLLFPWLTFLSAIIVTKNDDNLGVQYFRGLLPETFQFILKTIQEIVCLIFFLIMAWSSYIYVESSRRALSPMLGISRSWFYLSMLIMFAVMIPYQIRLIIANFIKGLKKLKAKTLSNN